MQYMNDESIPYSRLETNGIYFEKSEIIHPNYSLEKRIQLTNQTLFFFFALTQLQDLPRELIVYILQMNELISQFKNNFSITRLFELNKKYLLHTQHITVPQHKKIDCCIEYSIDEKPRQDLDSLQYQLHLICTNNTDAGILSERIKNMRHSIHFILLDNIIIFPMDAAYKHLRNLEMLIIYMALCVKLMKKQTRK